MCSELKIATFIFTLKVCTSYVFPHAFSLVGDEAFIVVWLGACVSVHSEHNSYSAAVRLAKRWLASQMLLSDFIEEEAVELIVASLYLSPAPFTPPRYESYFTLLYYTLHRVSKKRQ